MSGLPKLTQKAKPCNAGNYVGRYARSKEGRAKRRHPGARTSAVLLMPSTEPLVTGSHAASYLVRKEGRKKGVSQGATILYCAVALVGVAFLFAYFL